jgi:hypothetical protein
MTTMKKSKKAGIKSPEQLTPAQMVALLTRLQLLLYGDFDASGEEDKPVWDPDKDWDGDLMGELTNLFNEFGLAPTE